MKLNLRKLNCYLFIFLYAVIFLTILYKIFHVPITHDEVPTAVGYNDYNIWEIMMFPDASPNNHILNSILTKCSLFFFGNEQWAIRLPNLLSFVIYAIAVYRILVSVLKIESVFFIAASFLFVANPFLLDFFGLNRGYGLSLALCTLSVSYLITGFSQLKNRNIWFAFFLSILACYANFTLLVFWVATTVMVFYYFILVHKVKMQSVLKPVLLLIISCLSYLALIAVPIYKMQSTDQFQYWTSQGFFDETIMSLVIHGLYGSQYYFFQLFKTVAYLVVGAVIINLVYLVFKSKKTHFSLKEITQPVFTATLILVMTVGINILQSVLLNTPNLNGRTALFFYPLFVIMLVTSFHLLTKVKIRFFKPVMAFGIIFVCTFHLVNTMKMDSVREWWYDANTFKVIGYLDIDREDRKTSIETNWLFNPSFYYYKHTGKTPWLELKQYDKSIDINTDADYYYILSEDFEILESRFEPVVKFENNCWLLKRK